jgi:hypothetical protein
VKVITAQIEVDDDVDAAAFIEKLNEQARYATVYLPGRPAVEAVPARNVKLGEIKLAPNA